jgi:hypothetical protein
LKNINLNTKKDFAIYNKCAYLLGEILLDILINVFEDQPSINVFYKRKLWWLKMRYGKKC